MTLRKPQTTLIDKYHRHLNYLRISITDRCNLHCIYCMTGRNFSKLNHSDILTYEEILRVVNIAINMGITKVRITGGEPLVRKDVYDFLKSLTAIKELKDVSFTTNGVFLKQNLTKIQDAGIKRINVSMDTLIRQKFKQITGFDFFTQIWDGIEMAKDMGFDPVKLNVVVMKGINDNEISDFGRLAMNQPYHVRFIEYMPIGLSVKEHNDIYLSSSDIKQELNKLGKLIPVKKGSNDGPAERFKWEKSRGEIGFIHPISHHFCETCNRLRLTASGKLRPCLLSDYEIDLKRPLRHGCSDSEIVKIFLRAAKHKNLKHSRQKDFPGQMSAIGG
ncbi:GTP 3',8-cyclase [Candidatus Magnetomoraceae bacterium gMMP-15]